MNFLWIFILLVGILNKFITKYTYLMLFFLWRTTNTSNQSNIGSTTLFFSRDHQPFIQEMEILTSRIKVLLLLFNDSCSYDFIDMSNDFSCNEWRLSALLTTWFCVLHNFMQLDDYFLNFCVVLLTMISNDTVVTFNQINTYQQLTKEAQQKPTHGLKSESHYLYRPYSSSSRYK